MAKTTISGVYSTVLTQGHIYAYVTSEVAQERFELHQGKRSVPFVPTHTPPSLLDQLRDSYGLNMSDLIQHTVSEPLETTPGENFAVWINQLPDWSLSGHQTIQLMMPQRDKPCRIVFQDPIEVPQTRPGMMFQARLGSHRAAATLQVTFEDVSSGREVVKSVRFDPNAQGGTIAAGYQHVQLPIPDDFAEMKVHLSVQYDGYLPDDGSVEPFVFLTDIKVQVPLRTAAPVITPQHLSGSNATPNTAVLMQAHLPEAPAADAQLLLKLGRQSQHILTINPPQVTVVENHGHTLIARGEQVSQVVLCIDGTPVQAVTLSPHNSIIRIPNQYLDGTVHHISFKDQTGSFALWETQQILPVVLTPADIIQRETAARFPTELFAQTPLRYKGLKATVAAAKPETDMAQVAYALSVLEGGYDNVKLRPLHFPHVAEPKVSIVIPAHNKVEVTYLALCSLLVAHNEASFEVIVVDDASTDETTELEEIVSGITVLHNAQAQRFIRACNRGAEAARGEYIVLLNNDVEVTTGWIDELLAGFERFDNVGLVGSKLLYPNGVLQDAGGIIWGSGNPWNYGNSQNPNDPRFSYARQADYLSGAAMMVPAELWRELDGLSSYMEPMYFEDTDFAFKVREAGYSTWFIPSSIVYHYEGMTSGTDVSTGFKRYQEVNRPKFKRRWSKAFANFGKEGQNPDLEKDRGIIGRVLFIDYTTPRPDQDAGSYAALAEIKLVQSLGYKVTFLPANMAHLGRYTEDLQKLGVEVIHAPFYMTQAEYLSQHATDFDAFYITRYYVAQDVLPQIRSLAPQAAVLFNNADLHFLREIRAAKAEGDSARLENARQTRIDEMAIIKSVDVVLSYNDVEHSVIQALSEGEAAVVKCPWVVEVPEACPRFSERSGMSFLGSFRHHPNAEGIIWFAREIMPKIVSKAGEIELTIYGSGMSDDIRALKSDNVNPQGFVQDVADAYDQHRVFVAPLRSGAGIKGKVLSALAHGVPCVLTPTAAEGIGLRSGHDCFIVSNQAEWADAVHRLNTDEALWSEISNNARTYMRDAYSFEHGREKMRTAFETADLFGSRL